jgi:hypothetical protein
MCGDALLGLRSWPRHDSGQWFRRGRKDSRPIATRRFDPSEAALVVESDDSAAVTDAVRPKAQRFNRKGSGVKMFPASRSGSRSSRMKGRERWRHFLRWWRSSR